MAKKPKKRKAVIREIKPEFDPAWLSEEAWSEFDGKPSDQGGANKSAAQNPDRLSSRLSPRQRQVLEGWRGYP